MNLDKQNIINILDVIEKNTDNSEELFDSLSVLLELLNVSATPNTINFKNSSLNRVFKIGNHLTVTISYRGC